MTEAVLRFISQPHVVAVLINTVVALVTWFVFDRVSRMYLQPQEFTRANVRRRTIAGVLRGTARVFITLGWMVAVLEEFGVKTTTVIAGVSVVGLAVSFGAQNLIKDLITGFFIVLEDQYGIDDVITVNNNSQLSGTVENLSFRRTQLRSLDGTLHIIPNGQISTVSVQSQQWSRVVASVTISPFADVDAALNILHTVIMELYADPRWSENFLEPPEFHGVSKLSPEGVDIRALLKVQPRMQWSIGREFNLRIKKALNEAGVDLAVRFPHQ